MITTPTAPVFDVRRRCDGKLIGRRDTHQAAQAWVDGWRECFPRSVVVLDVVAWSPVVR